MAACFVAGTAVCRDLADADCACHPPVADGDVADSAVSWITIDPRKSLNKTSFRKRSAEEEARSARWAFGKEFWVSY